MTQPQTLAIVDTVAESPMLPSVQLQFRVDTFAAFLDLSVPDILLKKKEVPDSKKGDDVIPNEWTASFPEEIDSRIASNLGNRIFWNDNDFYPEYGTIDGRLIFDVHVSCAGTGPGKENNKKGGWYCVNNRVLSNRLTIPLESVTLPLRNIDHPLSMVKFLYGH
jgi:hypothetical protein